MDSMNGMEAISVISSKEKKAFIPLEDVFLILEKSKLSDFFFQI